MSPLLQEVLTYPSAPKNSTATKGSKKRALPNFMNSEESLRIMRDEKLKKARDVAAKQKKLREREGKKEAKRKEQEEKKRKREEKKREKGKSTTAKKRKVSQRNKGKQWRQGLPFDVKSCEVCLCEHDEADAENIPCIMCHKCQSWMHISCIPIGVDISSVDNGGNFICHDCI